ncbi:hypothetical protein [Pseudomonas sp. GD03730]|uniref:hypothetical protein n=1 Tax=Pseudomonas sp. GD03730 TaxID=2975375 RepID=UPI00244D1494|nr:hypothetical protein [Pseudomonas sp. GD03730]MDH1403717.1 hypothetical protein [Pseudomonas sp. GD03730]
MTERTAAVRAEEDRKLVMVSREKLEDLLTAHCWSCDKLDVANEFRELLAQPADPVRWGAPRTVRDLMRQLATLDPELEVFAMHRMPADFRDGRQVAAVHLSSSYERVTGRFLSDYKGDGRKVIAFWCQADQRVTCSEPDAREQFETAFVEMQVAVHGEGYRSTAVHMLKRDGEFEKPPSHYELHRREQGMYDSYWVEMLWWAWQASPKTTSAPLAVTMPTFEDYPASMERDLQAAFKQAIEAAGGQVTASTRKTC